LSNTRTDVSLAALPSDLARHARVEERRRLGANTPRQRRLSAGEGRAAQVARQGDRPGDAEDRATDEAPTPATGRHRNAHDGEMMRACSLRGRGVDAEKKSRFWFALRSL